VLSGSFVYYAGNTLPYPAPAAELLACQAAEAGKWRPLFSPRALCTSAQARGFVDDCGLNALRTIRIHTLFIVNTIRDHGRPFRSIFSHACGEMR